MNTELTDTNVGRREGWIFFDGECSFCTNCAWWFGSLLEPHGFAFEKFQTAWVNRRLGRHPDRVPDEMFFLTRDGQEFGGADAMVEIARRVWWGKPVFVLAQIPGAKILLRSAYRFVASKRNCLNGACAIPETRSRRRKEVHNSQLISGPPPYVGGYGDWMPLLVLSIAVLMIRDLLPPWVFMSLLAAALFYGCKWLTWRRALGFHTEAGKFASLGYLFGWIGMDARNFLGARIVKRAPAFLDWIHAGTRMTLGVVLIWLAARTVSNANPLVTGWMAMIGFVLYLHFGLFQLLTLAWRTAGFDAETLMRAPMRAASVTEFWGHRWNTAFHRLGHEFVFRPMVRRVGVGSATLAVFLVSGLIHDLLLSFPARGGYGLPTLYFLIQGAGVMLEHTAFGKRIGLTRGLRGRLFAIAMVAGPIPFLFHPPFIHNVILPMIHAIGST